MGDPKGFLKHDRATPTRRPVPVRILDWNEVYEPFPEGELRSQASRCMDCGIPFCNDGCPLGNLIPDWNDLVYRGDWEQAIERLHATNNFPEFTGRLCPAPCEGSCVLGINEPPVTIKQVEVEIIERAFEEGWVAPEIPAIRTGRTVAVVGSGPAGLAAAQQLTRAGHDVTVYERAERIGGLMRYGIPEFKMEKRFIDRRLAQMEAEGTTFRTGVEVGVDVLGRELRGAHDVVVLAGGATQWRDLPIPGRDATGIHQAMEYLPPSNRVQLGDLDEHPFSAEGKDVIIIGGGDTGADCLGTVLRQGAASVQQFEIMPEPPEARATGNPWPTWPLILRTPSAHEEAIEIAGDDVREYAINTSEFVSDADGHVEALQTFRVEQNFADGRMSFVPIEGTEERFPAQMVLLAMGFTGPERSPMLADLGVDLSDRGNVDRDDDWSTNVPGVYVCGDMGRGQSLIVWAIAEGRACASAVDEALMGDSDLPRPVRPTDAPIR
ncbi:MAG: glutamate synthase subunit beta [Acidimicrobiales bacterium]